MKPNNSLIAEPDENGMLFTVQLNDASEDFNSINWQHMCALQESTRQWLEKKFHSDQNIVDALIASGTRPRILIREEGVMLNLRGINFNDTEHPEDMISLRIWIDDSSIITCRRRDLRAIEDIIELINNGNGPNSTGDFVTMITTRMFDRMAPFMENLEDCVANSEEAVENDADETVRDNIALIRRRTAIYRRHIIPQKSILEKLTTTNFGWLSEQNKEDLIESLDQVVRYIEILNDTKDRTQILSEEIRSQQADRLNGTAYLFSVAATIFLPLSFLTGLLGVNISGMPGVDYKGAFWIFSVLCAVLVIIQIWLFRKLKWF